jgi:predicted Zn-dependent protease
MRLDSATLGKLIGHEVGHYLGLQHVNDANNLMLANTGVRGPDLSYDQYRTMFPHGFMVFV